MFKIISNFTIEDVSHYLDCYFYQWNIVRKLSYTPNAPALVAHENLPKFWTNSLFIH